jgi:hypothetical protein
MTDSHLKRAESSKEQIEERLEGEKKRKVFFFPFLPSYFVLHSLFVFAS